MGENLGTVFLRAIRQKDHHHFEIEWSDGIKSLYRLADLQRECPCAGCVDEISQKRLNKKEMTKDALEAISIKSVGRYGLQIRFKEGCSNGIYSYHYLRKKAQQDHQTKNTTEAITTSKAV